jgi:hypothetical protein
MNKKLKNDILNGKVALGISNMKDIECIEKVFKVDIPKDAKMFFYFDDKPISLSTYFNGYGMRIEDASILRGK